MRSSVPSTEEDRFPAGTLLEDRFRIATRLGKGGMGEVYRAHDLLLDLPVALKFLPQHFEDDACRLRALLGELRIARLIADDHVCRLYDIARHDDLHFITMQLIDGAGLDVLLHQVGGRLVEPKVLELTHELCRGLDAIHDKRILHRDLKPGNIMIDRRGRARITDFGLAVPAGAARKGEIAGTPEYMAPEQLDGVVEPRSDLYALGLVLYQCLTGTLPGLPGVVATPQEKIDALRTSREKSPAPPSRFVRIEHPRLEEALLRCLAPNPGDRFATARDLAVHLDGKPRSVDFDPFRLPSWSNTPTTPLLPSASVIDAWMQCVIDDHRSLLSPFDDLFAEIGRSTDLEEIFIEPSLVQEDSDSSRGLFGMPVSLPTLLDLNDAWATGRWLIYGDPGAGKTTLLRRCALRLARDASRSFVPFYTTLPRLLESDDLFGAADARLRRRGFPPGALRDALTGAESGRSLILLDGLDEIPRDRLDEAVDRLRDLDRRMPDATLVVTSRRVGGISPIRLGESFRALVLRPFDAEQQKRFLRLHLGRKAARIQRNLREPAGNPLYLALLTLLLEHGAVQSDEISTHRAKVYDQIFDLLFVGAHRFGGEPLPHRRAAREALGYLALALIEDDHDAEPFDALEARLLAPEAAELRERLAAHEPWKRPLVFLEDLARRTGILGPHDGPRAPWRFWHRSFCEAAAAEELQRRGEADALARAERLGEDASRWAEPYALYAGRLDRPDELVRNLMRVCQELGLCALKGAKRLGANTIEDVLELVEDEEQRDEIYARMLDMLGEVEADDVEALLERLRVRRGRGGEIYFLDRTAREALRDAWSEQLFAELSNPPNELFRVASIPGGEVELWREIPAGSFEMGSPDGTGEVWETRRRVEIVTPLRIARVPVTNAQYAAFDPEHEWKGWPGVPRDELAHHPVVNVNWYEAMAFCVWLRQLPGFEGARLPTEAEWEYACRAEDRDESEGPAGWSRENAGRRTHRTAELAANSWGLWDMLGNVFEWCGSRGVCRGGSWITDVRDLRPAYRLGYAPGSRWSNVGFRVVLGDHCE